MRHSLDFEYNHVNNEFLHPVCVSLDDTVYWLNDGSETEKFKAKMREYEGDDILSHAASLAEIPACMVLGIDVEKYTWVCTDVLFKVLRIFEGRGCSEQHINHSFLGCLKYYGIAHAEQVAEQLANDVDGMMNDKSSLVKSWKESMRYIILSNKAEEHKREVIDYCKSDTEDLGRLYDAELADIKKYEDKPIQIAEFGDAWHVTRFKYDFLKQRLSLNSIANAKMYFESFDINLRYIKNLGDRRFISLIMKDANDIVPGLFDECGKQNNGVLRDWLFSTYPEAMQFWKDNGFYTEKTKAYSMSDDNIKKFCDGRTGINDLQRLRQLFKLKKAASGILAPYKTEDGEIDRTSKNWYFPNTYSDGTHSCAGEYEAKTTRFGMKATKACVPSWSKALRSALRPADDKHVYFSMDYSAQEIWVIAQLAKDRDLLRVYKEEDIYMATALQMGLYVPPAGHPGVPSKKAQKESWFLPYKPLRAQMKSLILGMNYGMSERSFAERNKMDLEKAKSLYKMYDKAFHMKAAYSKAVWAALTEANVTPNYETSNSPRVSYEAKGSIMIGQEQIIRSVVDVSSWRKMTRERRQFKNFPVQCVGAQITRQAIRLAQARGLHPFIPMHDEIYFKTTPDRLKHDILLAKQCLVQAARDSLYDRSLCDEFPIKVGEPEIMTHDSEEVVHDGAEQMHAKLMEYFDKLEKRRY